MPTKRILSLQDNSDLSNYFFCLARKISNRRRQLGLSQKELAHRTGISCGYLGKLESGVGLEGMSFQVLYTISTQIHMPIHHLVYINNLDKACAKSYLRKRILMANRNWIKYAPRP